VGIPSSRDPNTPEGLESRLSIEIRRIPAELPHSTELELKKLCRTRMDFGRASVLKLLRGLPTSQEVLRPLEPRLYLYSTKFEFGSPLGGRGAKPHFLHTFCWGEHWGIYRRSKTVLWPKIGCVRSACQAGRPCNLVGRASLLALPLGIGYLEHHLYWPHRQNGFWKYTNTWLVGQGGVAGRPLLGSVEPVLCATSSLHVILSMTMPYFGHNEDMHGFWFIWCFSII
jgi:hypothetical protein